MISPEAQMAVNMLSVDVANLTSQLAVLKAQFQVAVEMAANINPDVWVPVGDPEGSVPVGTWIPTYHAEDMRRLLDVLR